MWHALTQPRVDIGVDTGDKGALAPMNKFACKLHGYIIYLIEETGDYVW